MHLNLLRGGVVKDLNGLNRSPWSGHSALLGKVERKWQDIEYDKKEPEDFRSKD